MSTHICHSLFESLGQIGKLACDRHRVRAPRTVEAAAEGGGQSEPDRTAHAPPIYIAGHAETARSTRRLVYEPV